MKNNFNPFCLSSYLAFRYVVKPNLSWVKNKTITPKFPNQESNKKIKVETALDIIKNLSKIISKYKNKKVGFLLSSGIDSAIIASFLPKNTIAYTIKFLAPNAIDESKHASKIAKHLGIQHKIIKVTWKDYQKYQNQLMLNKKSPLHPVEISLYIAAIKAKQDGINYLLVGNGADSIFGGLDKLLSKEWKLREFINRFNILNPKKILKNPVDITYIYKHYLTKKKEINLTLFIKEIYEIGLTQWYKNGIESAGCNMISPFEKLALKTPLDINRIRNGEPKYLLQEVYKEIFPKIKPIPKKPFVRPMDQWMKDWGDIHRPEFRTDINLQELNGEQKWLIYCLQEFMDLIEK